MLQREPTNSSMRQYLDAVLKTDSDLDAFFIDHFKDCRRRVSNGMDRESKLNILLEREECSEILQHLYSSKYKELAQKNKHILHYRTYSLQLLWSFLQDVKNVFIIGRSPSPTRSSMRKLLNAILKDDTDINSFCLDHFPKVKLKFSNGMDRDSKLNILFSLNSTARILLALQESHKDQVLKHGKQ